MNKFILPIAIIATVIIAFVGWTLPKTINFGGTTADFWSAASYQVSGTEVISSSRAISGTTLTLTGEADLSTLIQGGTVTTLTADASNTIITAAQICDSSVINIAPSSTHGTASTTFPATTTLMADCFTANGDFKELIFRNTAAAASTTILLATSGITLLEPDGQNVIIAGANSVLLKFIRATANEIIVIVDELIDAD